MNMMLSMDYTEDAPGFWLEKLKGFISGVSNTSMAAASLMVPESYINQCLQDEGQITGPTKLKLLIASGYTLDIQTLIISMVPAKREPWLPLLHNHYPEKTLTNTELVNAYLKLKRDCKDKTFADLNKRLGLPSSYRYTQTRIPPAGVVSIYALLLLKPSINTLIDSLPTADRDGYVRAVHWSTSFIEGTHDLLIPDPQKRVIKGRLTSSIRLTREQHDAVSERAHSLGLTKIEFMSRAIAYAIHHDVQLTP